MKLKDLKVLDIERLGDTDEGTEASIAADSLPFVFEILSSQFYANPIGSVIREITSNCFDSHAEAGIDEPIVIRKGYDDEEGYFIEFEDFGVGLSVERMYNVYTNYFSSTKRHTNNLIGGFGLGSKTPLAYAEYFYITTVFDGMQYNYLYHKGDSKPTLESLNGYETEEEEYIVTTIKGEDGDIVELDEPITRVRTKRTPVGIPVEQRNGTVIKIIIESGDLHKFESELASQLTYFDSVYYQGWRNSNDYQIYEGKSFLFRSDVRQDSTQIHLCIGKVRYPIDIAQIAIKREHRSIPIGIKFEIGELQITPNRESIRYTEEAKALILQRLKTVVEELTEIYNKQNPVIETLREYIATIGSDAKIVFNAEKGHTINLWSYSSLDRKYKFKPIADIGLKLSPTVLFFGWERIGRVSGGIYTPSNYSNSIENRDIINNSFILTDRQTRYSKYTAMKIGQDIGDVVVYQKKDIDFDEIERYLDISEKQIGKAILIYKYNKIIEGFMKEYGKGYYNDYRPTDEWIAEQRKLEKESTLAFRRKRDKLVFLRKISSHGSIGADYKVIELENRTGILVYGFKEDKEDLVRIYSIVTNNVATIKKLNYDEKLDKAFMVMQISQAAERDIVGGKKTIYWRDFLETKFFRKIQYMHWLKIQVNSSNIGLYKDLKKKLIPGYREDMEILEQTINTHASDRLWEYLFPEPEVIDPKAVKLFNYMFAKYNNLRIPLQGTISTVPNDKENRKEYIEFLKYKGIRLLNEYYLKDKRQLEYEKNIQIILNIISDRIKPQLLLTINTNKNDNEDSNTKDTNEEIRDTSEEGNTYNCYLNYA